jgi:hypothetical protein
MIGLLMPLVRDHDQLVDANGSRPRSGLVIQMVRDHGREVDANGSKVHYRLVDAFGSRP